ncbi:arylamine N-acetyltransferase (plasmid) [Mammaliicoccus sciuri]|uniref:arylamine N-acetyltransferase n=1 Tax=Mammaliicoccus sciuri TaxID=1296 RepID=UPI002DC03BCF|nr:arylamine N-acetyltransferase [Mammaliicoccus sciuri]
MKFRGALVSLIVTINNYNYVGDVGYGELPHKAIPIVQENNSLIITDINGGYHSIYKATDLVYVQKWKENVWQIQYEAILERREIHDFDYYIEYNQNNPNSTFVKHLLITTVPKYYDRATMTYNKLTLTKENKKEQFEVLLNTYRKFSKKDFNLNVEIKRLE